MTTFFDTRGTGYKAYRDMMSCFLLQKECRFKSLRDRCLECIGKNLHCITRASQYLAPLHKELLIERLAFHDQLEHSYLPHVTYNLFSPLLKRIYLYKCHQIDETMLKLLAESKCQLHYLTIHDCQQVTDAGIMSITKGQIELRELELRKLKISKKGLLNIKSPCLEKVNFRGCPLLDFAAVQVVVAANPTIKYLNLVACHKLTDQVFPIIAQCLNTRLLVLDVADVLILSDYSIESLAEHCPNLQGINLLGCNRLTDVSVNKLSQKCPHLKNIDLSYCTKLVESPFGSRQMFINLPEKLEELCLNGIPLDDGNLLVEAVGRLHNLKRVKLCGVPALDDTSLQQIMEKVGSHLEYFDICGSVMSRITDLGLESIATHCQVLEMLGISLLKDVTGISLLPMLEDPHRAPMLKKVMLCCRKLDVAVMDAVIDNCSNLEYLDVSGQDAVTDKVLQSLAVNCPQLSSLNVKACRYITDAGVCAVAQHCPLCVIILSGLRNLTDKSVLALANNCPYLEEIYISGCDKVSKAAIQYLQDKCICRLFVSHRVPNAQGTAHNLDTGDYVPVP